MATTPSITPPKDISGRMGALAVGKMLGVKSTSVSSIMANSKVKTVLNKEDLRFLKGKASLSTGRIPKRKMIDMIKRVQKTVRNPNRAASITNIDAGDKYRTPTRVYAKYAGEPRRRQVANEKVARARSMQEKIGEARNERYKGVASHRQPGKSEDGRRPGTIAGPSTSASQDDPRSKALKRINQEMKGKGEEKPGVKSSALESERSQVSSLPEETGLPQQRTSQSSRGETKTTRSTDIPLEQSDQKPQIGGNVGEKSDQSADSNIETNLPF